MRVFVADDSATLRKRLVEMLTGIPGIQVVGSAGNARDAIDLIRQSRPDAVLLDIRLSDNSGFQVLRSIKSLAAGSPVAIVFTNEAFPQYRKEYIAAGADYFFDKSTEFEKVRHVLKQMMEVGRDN
jgi:DNA-binding NarL/FixJ family response regulator